MAKNAGPAPAGAGDMLFERCAALKRTESRLSAVYAARGYREVATSAFEYYDTFLLAGNPLTQDRMWVVTAGDGRLHVLRPDSTTPIARIAARRLCEEPLPLRLCYNQYVFRREQGGRAAVIPQSGIELLGAVGVRADAEAVMTAIAALDSLGLEGFKLELGHVGLFKRLTALVPFSEEDLEYIRQDIQNKNCAALNETLAPYRAEAPGPCAAIAALPKLFGGADVFREARALIDDRAALSILDELETLLARLESVCPATVIVDLGLVQHINYYSGLVFKGYLAGTGEAALSGGRYDGLLAHFGRPLSAVGFALSLDAVLAALERAHRLEPAPPCDALLYFEERDMKNCYETLAALERAGLRCEVSFADSLDEARQAARKEGVARVVTAEGEVAP